MKTILTYILTIVTFCYSCTNHTPHNDPIPPHQSFNIQSTHLGELRTINVWLPDSALSESTALPVIYMLDGGTQEDFPHLANTIAELIRQQKIKPVILVGIENIERRKDLTGTTTVESDKKIAPVVGGSALFRSFIEEELFPEIEKRYNTTTEKTIIGESAAGLFVLETLFLKPQLFNNYIAFDPSLWWNDHYLVRNAKEYLSKNENHQVNVWFAGSNSSDIYPYTRELATVLKNENYPNIEWQYLDEPNESHSTIFRATKEKALLSILGKQEDGQ